MIHIEEKQRCCGCEACKQICPKQCISMKQDEEGFRYPQVEKTRCVDCKLCEKVCPQLNLETKSFYEIQSYVAFSRDMKIRTMSSSGGLFSAFAKYILREKGIVFGAAFDEDFMVHHIGVNCVTDLPLLQGSKYMQSRMEDSYQYAKNYLEEGRKVLFSGTACQIAGLKKYLKKDWPNLFTIDVLCHGVPSPRVWKRYLLDKEKTYGANVQQIFFRHKKYGWKTYAVLMEFANNTAYERVFNQDAFMQMFLSNICLRPACYACKFKDFPRPSDITLGDCWGVERHSPEMDDGNGTSVLVVNSNKGKQLLENICEEITAKEMSLDEILPVNADSRMSVAPHYNRKKFFTVLNNGGGDRGAVKTN